MRAFRWFGLHATLAAACVLVWAASPASAAVSWVGTPTTILDTGALGNAYQRFGSAMDPAGDSVGVGGQGSGSPNGKADVLSRPTGGSFASPVQLESAAFPTCNSTTLCAQPVDVGFDNTGNEYAFVTASDGNPVPSGLHNHEWILAHGASTWTGPTAITNENPDEDASAAAVNGSGLQVIAWSNTSQIRVAMRAAGGSWPATSTLVASIGHPGAVAKVVIDANGDVALTYTFFDGAIHHAEVAFLPAGSSTWSNQDLFPTRDTTRPDIGIDDGGNVTAVFTRDTNGAGTANAISYETRSFLTGTWTSNGSPPNLDTLGSNQFAAHIAVNSAGQAAAVWTNHPAASDVPEMSARSSSTASFDAPTDPSSSVGDGDAVAVSPQGLATALWVSGGSIEGAQHAAAGSWTKFTAGGTAPASVSQTAVKLAEDGQGNGFVVFQDSASQKTSAIGLAVAGPNLSSATIPSSGTVGTPVAFSVSPTSVWGSVTTTSVDFGDGTGLVNGTSGTHTFTTPGNFTVTFSSTDSFGNTSTKQLTIAIASPAGGGGGGGTGGGAGGGTGVPGGGGATTTHVPPKPHLGHKISPRKHAVTFTFKAAGASRFGCSLVKLKRHSRKKPKPHYSLCRSPKKYRHLKRGSYEFFVRGANGAGSGKPATFKFKI